MTPLETSLCRAVERHVAGPRGTIGSARRRDAAPALIALGEATALLALYLPRRCPEQERIGRVLHAIEKAVAATPAGRRWARA